MIPHYKKDLNIIEKVVVHILIQGHKCNCIKPIKRNLKYTLMLTTVDFIRLEKEAKNEGREMNVDIMDFMFSASRTPTKVLSTFCEWISCSGCIPTTTTRSPLFKTIHPQTQFVAVGGNSHKWMV